MKYVRVGKAPILLGIGVFNDQKQSVRTLSKTRTSYSVSIVSNQVWFVNCVF